MSNPDIHFGKPKPTKNFRIRKKGMVIKMIKKINVSRLQVYNGKE